MKRTLMIAGLAVAVLALTSSQGQAQSVRPTSPGYRPPPSVAQQSQMNLNRAAVNPNYYLPSGVSVRQAAYNTAVLGRAYQQVPPYALGYNPYPTVVNYGTVIPITTSPLVNPYLYGGYNPYLGALGGGYGPYGPFGP